MYVITGGAGFLGSVLLWQLNSQGRDDIVVVDHLGAGPKWRNLVKRRYADYLHKDRFLDLVRRDAVPFKVDALVHLGACSSTTEADADFLMENNFHYSREVCRYALDKGARVINASSAATYGDGSLGFSDDAALVPGLRPLNMYGYSKQLFDLWLLREGLANEVASLKFFNVYGPNEYHKGDMASVVLKAHGRIRETGRMALFRSDDPAVAHGEQKRDFVYAKDCALLMAWLLENPRVNGIRNVGTGNARSFNDLTRAVFAALGREPAIDYVDMPEALRGKYQAYTQADMAWLAESGCPVRFTPLEEGVADYVRAHLEAEDRFL
ncbi:ADP-glyceromanno-heptose 6-epimerase [Desulfovibrio sp.]|uniref:ADP-glyceromanno-heptose 6-epimerase n=1 Tax=Desulfovibrio sp. TaxID=885 RepID=UPI0023D23AC4|nr:ADP-glyceromanno-heptose 6-epimerase [Desulfovibrio sp.]MDE7240530.1 ADP-glyceromanno-heptose 6-epimerase [Desulfovibrio sp.]